MNGAESLVHTLLAAGVDTCFANPGTSEMHFVAALDTVEGMRCVLGLHETVVTGMADGYWRASRKPAATLLHCGPGLANGIANLHNARRARSGIVNIVGDHATYHRQYDAPLTADTPALAATVSTWVRTSTESGAVGADAAEAVQAAMSPPGQIATLILPSDTSWNDGGLVASALPVPEPQLPVADAVNAVAEALIASKDRALILLGGEALRPEGQTAAWQIASHTGATVMVGSACPVVARGIGRLPIERVPYVVPAAVRVLAEFETIILVNTDAPVGFFAYPDTPSVPTAADARILTLSAHAGDGLAALRALIDRLGAAPVSIPNPTTAPSVQSGPVTSEGFAETLAALMPEESVVVDESITFGRSFYPHTAAAPAHDFYHVLGGAIGEGVPLATGAALGSHGQRRVINLEADGSAMYSLQGLWTQAREQLPVTTVIMSNRRYNILIGEYQKVGATPGATAMSMLDLGNPNLGWCELANGMGVEAAVAPDLDSCADLLRTSFDKPGPFLIELLID